MSTYWLPKPLEDKHLLLENAYILTLNSSEVLKAWLKNRGQWANAGMCPPTTPGPYLILYQPADPIPTMGFSIFNKGWTAAQPFVNILDALKPHGRELPHIPYDLSQLYWKGVSAQL